MSSGTIRVVVNAVYRSGGALFTERAFPADARVLSIERTEAFRVVELRLILPTRNAAELCDALSSGMIELNIDGVKSLVE